ncbi:MAG: alcohol dehydrogenase catalytic domain-containing protein [Usitatibacteraceae bacterium]
MSIPETMRAVLLTGNGGFDQLELRDDVSVSVAGPGEVLIKIGAAGVNNTDINTRIGWYSKAVAEATETGGTTGLAGAEDDGWSGAAFQFPRIQGADACGRIVAVGVGVDTTRIGQRVLVEPVFRGATPFDASYFGSEVDGAFADFACVPAIHTHRIESSLNDTELASFPCAYSAAENMLTRIALASGERVLITGASGGVGSAAVQLAKRRGAEVIAIAGADKAEAVRALAQPAAPEGELERILRVLTDTQLRILDAVCAPDEPIWDVVAERVCRSIGCIDGNRPTMCRLLNVKSKPGLVAMGRRNGFGQGRFSL